MPGRPKTLKRSHKSNPSLSTTTIWPKNVLEWGHEFFWFIETAYICSPGPQLACAHDKQLVVKIWEFSELFFFQKKPLDVVFKGGIALDFSKTFQKLKFEVFYQNPSQMEGFEWSSVSFSSSVHAPIKVCDAALPWVWSTISVPTHRVLVYFLPKARDMFFTPKNNFLKKCES